MHRHDVQTSTGTVSVWRSAGDRCDLLLLHSLGSTGHSFEPFCAALPDRTDCVAPDLWGHGYTPMRRPLTIEALADDVAELIPSGATPVVMGVSYGGVVAQVLAARHPECVRHLVLSNTFANWPGGEVRYGQHRAALESAGSEAAWRAARQASPALVADAPAASVALYREAAGQISADDFFDTAAITYVADTLSLWPLITCPVTVVTGEQESRIPLTVTAQLAVLAGGRPTRVVGGADHLPHLDRPAEMAAIVAEILAATTSDSYDHQGEPT